MTNQATLAGSGESAAVPPPFDEKLLDEAIKDLQKFKEKKVLKNLIEIDNALTPDYPGQVLTVRGNGPLRQRLKETIKLLSK